MIENQLVTNNANEYFSEGSPLENVKRRSRSPTRIEFEVLYLLEQEKNKPYKLFPEKVTIYKAKGLQIVIVNCKSQKKFKARLLSPLDSNIVKELFAIKI